MHDGHGLRMLAQASSIFNACRGRPRQVFAVRAGGKQNIDIALLAQLTQRCLAQPLRASTASTSSNMARITVAAWASWNRLSDT
jgi:hypothetical protein